MVRKIKEPYENSYNGEQIGELKGITFEQLRKALGKNEGPLNDGENAQWWLELDDGTPVTVYDWHPTEYRKKEDITNWFVKTPRPGPNVLRDLAFEISAELADVS